jgi:hypothetical protein
MSNDKDSNADSGADYCRVSVGIWTMPASFARKLAHFIELSETEIDVLLSMPARFRDVRAKADIVSDGEWPTDLSLITEGFACRYKLLAGDHRQIMAFLIPGISAICEPC